MSECAQAQHSHLDKVFCSITCFILQLPFFFFLSLGKYSEQNLYCKITCSGNMINKELSGTELSWKKLLVLIYSIYIYMKKLLL